LYVNTDRGNFKSENSGITFQPINNGWTSAFADAIAFDNASDPSLYVATRDGHGIQRTGQDGVHYQQLTNPTNSTRSSDWPHRLAVAHDNSNIVVTATRFNGIFSSNNGGRTWTRAHIDTGQREFATLAIDPLNSQNVYAIAQNSPAS